MRRPCSQNYSSKSKFPLPNYESLVCSSPTSHSHGSRSIIYRSSRSIAAALSGAQNIPQMAFNLMMNSTDLPSPPRRQAKQIKYNQRRLLDVFEKRKSSTIDLTPSDVLPKPFHDCSGQLTIVDLVDYATPKSLSTSKFWSVQYYTDQNLADNRLQSVGIR